MKKVLITGASGFIGSFLQEHLSGYEIYTLSLRDPNWKNQPFDADVVIHCAGLAHSRGYSSEDYFEINSKLTIDFAQHCMKTVSHFIYLSSLIVYGEGTVGLINSNSPLEPISAYGKSKVEAEKGLLQLQNKDYKVSILRLPLVYGKGVSGNLRTLVRFSKYIFVLPRFKNQRAMINLQFIVEFVESIIKKPTSESIFILVDKEPYGSVDIIRSLRSKRGLRSLVLPFPKSIINFLINHNNPLSKLLGDSVVDLGMVNVIVNKRSSLMEMIESIYE